MTLNNYYLEKSKVAAIPMHNQFFLMLICLNSVAFGQSEEIKKTEYFKPTHSFGLIIGHAHVLNGRDAHGDKKTLILPYWGLDYNFQFAPKFYVGLHTDFIMETYEVEKHLKSGSEEVVERTWPIAPAVMGFYKPTEHWNVGFGMGGEFSKEEDYVLNRLAVEYAAEIKHGWEVFGVAQYDFRWDAYDTWSIGMGIAKAFGHK